MPRTVALGDWNDEQPVPEAALARLLIEAGSVILRAPDEKTMFERVCRLLIDLGGFQLAWVALMEPAGDRLVEVELAAHDAETIEALREHASSEQGRRVLTRRLKGREPWVINVVAEREDTDPDNPWASLAARSSVGSMAFLPIIAGHVVHGVLVLATNDSGFFTPDRLLGLERLPRDLAVKLDWLGRYATGVMSHYDHHQVNARARAFFDAAPQAILLLSNDEVETNGTFVTMFGADRRPADLSRYFAPGIWTYMLELNRRRLDGRASLDRYRAIGVRRDGTPFPILVQVTTVDLEAGQAHAVFITDLSPDLPQAG